MKKRILIVDDDIDVINIVQTILENEGHEVIVANDKVKGLEKAKAEKPDMAILDVMMNTKYEGFELAAELTKSDEFQNMPVFMQTSIEVFKSNDDDTMRFARQYRANMNNNDLEVLLVEDPATGMSGIDYRNENGELIWLPIDGFIRKPVKAQTLIEAVNKLN